MAETDAHLAGEIEKDEQVLEDRTANDQSDRAAFEAWRAEKKAKDDHAASEEGFQDRVAEAVRAELERRGVQDDPSRKLTEEELAPGRQLSPMEQAHFNRTRQIPDEGQYHALHLTSHVPL